MSTKARKKYMREYRQENKERCNETQRIWRANNKEQHYEQVLRWREKHPDKYEIRKEAMRNRPRDRSEEYKKRKKKVNKYIKSNPLKIKAQQIGKTVTIPDGALCVICDHRPAIQRHHPNYSKPREVLLVCGVCHAELDKLRRLLEDIDNGK